MIAKASPLRQAVDDQGHGRSRRDRVGDRSVLFGGIEAGGTKFVAVVGCAPDDIRAELRVPTTSAAATIDAVVQFFREQQATHGPIASFERT